MRDALVYLCIPVLIFLIHLLAGWLHELKLHSNVTGHQGCPDPYKNLGFLKDLKT